MKQYCHLLSCICHRSQLLCCEIHTLQWCWHGCNNPKWAKKSKFKTQTRTRGILLEVWRCCDSAAQFQFAVRHYTHVNGSCHQVWSDSPRGYTAYCCYHMHTHFCNIIVYFLICLILWCTYCVLPWCGVHLGFWVIVISSLFYLLFTGATVCYVLVGVGWGLIKADRTDHKHIPDYSLSVLSFAFRLCLVLADPHVNKVHICVHTCNTHYWSNLLLWLLLKIILVFSPLF